MPSVEFGFALPIFASPGLALFRTPCYERLDVRQTMEAAVEAERLGYDALWVADHLYHGRDGEILECWTTLSVLAGLTRRVSLGPIRLNSTLRHPALTAKMASTLDQLSGGRLIFFSDIGWREVESDAYGLPFERSDEVRVVQMRDGLELIRRLWTDSGATTYRGPYHQVTNAYCHPKPVRKPHPPIWIGESLKPATSSLLLDVAMKYGDAWALAPTPASQVKHKLARLEVACTQTGRIYDTLKRAMTTQVLVAQTRQEVRATFQHIEALGAWSEEAAPSARRYTQQQAAEEFLIGTPDEVTDRLREYVALGITHFIMWFLDFPSLRGLRLFAEGVMPHFTRSV
ncbi:MAG: LLM class flavin-dependent oxidoreductase [Chloroflexota bacterium]|nr:LLM class flavin-dependent oxidoreductase [Chloroflexota bacterium]